MDRGDGGLLRDADGYRFMPDVEPEKKELASRDVVSRRMEERIAQGKGVKSRWGEHLWLDITLLGEHHIKHKLREVYEICHYFLGVDPTKEYSFVADKYGKYTVRYSAEDTSGNKQPLQYAINVEDDVPPDIVFAGEFAAEAKVGDVLVIPEFTVSDNLGGEVTVYKYCYTSNGVLVSIPENSNSIKCRYEGGYEFRIFAVDETGNIAVKTAQIVVSA